MVCISDDLNVISIYNGIITREEMVCIYNGGNGYMYTMEEMVCIYYAVNCRSCGTQQWRLAAAVAAAYHSD